MKIFALCLLVCAGVIAQFPVPNSGGNGGAGGGGLGSNPAPCTSGEYVTDIAQDGTLTCAALPAGSYFANFASATTWTLTGATHGLGTADLEFVVRSDDGTYYVKLEEDVCKVHKTTYDVVCTFAAAQAGRLGVIKGGGGGGGGDTTSVSNTGAGAAVLKTSTNVVGRTLVAGTNTTVTENTDTITIASTGGDTTSVANSGASGAAVLKTATNVTARKLVAGSGITITENTDDISIAATGSGVAPTWLTATVADVDVAPLTTACESQRTTTVSGATVGWVAIVAPPADFPSNAFIPTPIISAPNTVKWNVCAIGTANPAIGTYTVWVIPPTL